MAHFFKNIFIFYCLVESQTTVFFYLVNFVTNNHKFIINNVEILANDHDYR